MRTEVRVRARTYVGLGTSYVRVVTYVAAVRRVANEHRYRPPALAPAAHLHHFFFRRTGTVSSAFAQTLY